MADSDLGPPPQPDRTSQAVSFSNISNRSKQFTVATRACVNDMYDEKCWACGTEFAQIAHVIAQEDKQARLWQDMGLIDFAINSKMNAMPLCGACHLQFDYLSDPGFFFMPTDIDYFIEFEIEDRKRRRKEAQNGAMPGRKTPSAEMYRRHQLSRNQITESANGGLYNPIFVKKYLCHRISVDYAALSKPLSWHGAPVASFRRAFPILGSARVGVLDKKTLKKLEQLRSLYFLDDEDETEISGRKTDSSALDPDHEEEHPNEEEDLNPHNETKSTRKSYQSKKRKLNKDKGNRQPLTDKTTTYCPILDREVTAFWDLGPEMSTEDAVRLITPTL